MHDYERKQLLERVEREGATVGASVPKTLEIDGESLDLRDFVFETRRQDSVPADHRERVEAVKTKLRRERTRRRETLETGSISVAEGEQLVESIVGIDRALDALGALEPDDLEAEREATERADRKRWLQFLQKALGQDGESGDRRARGGP